MGRERRHGGTRAGSRAGPAALLLALAVALAWVGLARTGWARGEQAPTVSVREHPELGQTLVGPDGRTLYVFDRDPAGVSTCKDGCARNWPPLLGGEELLRHPELGGALGLIRRPAPDRGVQVTYRGRPLHYWSRDRAPGEARGHGAGASWFVARP